jgi:hypothetical protein
MEEQPLPIRRCGQRQTADPLGIEGSTRLWMCHGQVVRRRGAGDAYNQCDGSNQA